MIKSFENVVMFLMLFFFIASWLIQRRMAKLKKEDPATHAAVKGQAAKVGLAILARILKK